MRCPNGGKVCYNSEEQAKQARRTLRDKVDHTLERRIYRCQNCGKWHLTSSKY
jgi:lipopolysaccharide biosynthesis regulator YciM